VFLRRRPEPTTWKSSRTLLLHRRFGDRKAPWPPATGKLWFFQGAWRTARSPASSKNQEKDVWHALLSFQGTGSAGLTRDDAVPPAYLGRISVQRPNLQFASFSIPRQRFFAASPGGSGRCRGGNEGWKRTGNPFGDAQYRAWRYRCQEKL
jgi:hypothetical protein